MIKETTKKKERSEKRIMESTKYGESEISADIKRYEEFLVKPPLATTILKK